MRRRDNFFFLLFFIFYFFFLVGGVFCHSEPFLGVYSPWYIGATQGMLQGWGLEGWGLGLADSFFQRKTKGQQLKGKIVSEFFTFFHELFRTFSEFFPQDFPLQKKGFSARRTKEKKRQ